MNRPFSPPLSEADRHSTDFASWAHEQAALVRAGNLEALDLENVAEELESLGNEQEHAIESHMIRILEHLLKLDHSGDVDPRGGWMRTIREQRRRLERRFRRNPSLFARRAELLQGCWSYGRETAADGLRGNEAADLPELLPYSVGELLDPRYFGAREATA